MKALYFSFRSLQTVPLLQLLQRFLPALGEGCFIICGDLCISGPSFTLMQVKTMKQKLLSQRISKHRGKPRRPKELITCLQLSKWRWLMRFSGSEGLLLGFQRTTEIWKLGTSIRDVSRETASCCVFAHGLQRSLICSDVKLYLLSDPGNATVTVLTPQCVAQTPGVCFCYKNIA